MSRRGWGSGRPRRCTIIPARLADGHLTPDAAYQRITIDDQTVDVLSSSGSRLTGSFDGSANLFAVGVNYQF